MEHLIPGSGLPVAACLTMELTDIWGIKENIGPLELAARAAVMFVVSLVLLRLSGMRPFGRENTFDTIITFLIGGILSRGVVGATPFLSCIAGAGAILLANKAVAKLSQRSASFEKLVKGGRRLLYRDGQFIADELRRVSISETDVREQLRIQLNTESLDDVSQIFVEKSGKISFVRQ
ncbi:MAG: DUF421 domain-containing protein [Chitinophagaceae bacterium]|nr:MAG: DUF421 domain-containing protein [Chitinophagaceae bacterium]